MGKRISLISYFASMQIRIIIYTIVAIFVPDEVYQWVLSDKKKGLNLGDVVDPIKVTEMFHIQWVSYLKEAARRRGETLPPYVTESSFPIALKENALCPECLDRYNTIIRTEEKEAKHFIKCDKCNDLLKRVIVI